MSNEEPCPLCRRGERMTQDHLMTHVPTATAERYEQQFPTVSLSLRRSLMTLHILTNDHRCGRCCR